MLKATALLVMAGLAIAAVVGLGFAIVAAAWPWLLALLCIVLVTGFVLASSKEPDDADTQPQNESPQ